MASDDNFDDDLICKAAWRRIQRSNHHKHVGHLHGGLCHLVASGAHRAKRKKMGSCGVRVYADQSKQRRKAEGKAVRHVPLLDWYRSALSKHLEEIYSADEHDAQDDEPDMPPRGGPEVAADAERGAQRLPSPVGPRGARHTVSTADASTQCSPEEMLRPMEVREILGRAPACMNGKLLAKYQQMGLMKLQSDVVCSGVSYSVDLHFSLFEEPHEVAAKAAGLSDAKLQDLAERFMGQNWVAGVPVVQRNEHVAWEVPERRVTEAAVLAQMQPCFRKYLVVSSRRLLLGCLKESAKKPLDGRSLLHCADENAARWAKLAHVALDFLRRLILAGAIPRAFAAEIIKHVSGACASLDGFKLGFFTILPAVRHSAHRPAWRPPRLQRSVSVPLGRGRPPPFPGLYKTESAPPVVQRRSFGTSLRPQDEELCRCKARPGEHPFSGTECEPRSLVGYSRVSMGSFDKVDVEEIPILIDDSSLIDYWFLRNYGGAEFEMIRSCRGVEYKGLASAVTEHSGLNLCVLVTAEPFVAIRAFEAAADAATGSETVVSCGKSFHECFLEVQRAATRIQAAQRGRAARQKMPSD